MLTVAVDYNLVSQKSYNLLFQLVCKNNFLFIVFKIKQYLELSVNILCNLFFKYCVFFYNILFYIS